MRVAPERTCETNTLTPQILHQTWCCDSFGWRPISHTMWVQTPVVPFNITVKCNAAYKNLPIMTFIGKSNTNGLTGNRTQTCEGRRPHAHERSTNRRYLDVSVDFWARSPGSSEFSLSLHPTDRASIILCSSQTRR